ncbi:hypothetical protein PRIPAC_73175 [Pristionchus pacificus]|nr:hypothetical protein PRIPAC_73175 [Pristionchus pacificus]
MSRFTRILSPIATRLRPTPTSFSSHPSTIVHSYRYLSSVTFKPTNPAINITTPSSTPSAVLDRVKQMNEYYEQYIEEYTEEIDDGRVVEPERPREEKKVARSLSALVDVLRDARALDIAVFSLSDDHPPGRRDLPQSEGEEQAPCPPFTIVCTPMNSRHGRAVAAALSESAKVSEGTGTRRTSKRASGWLVVHVSEADTTVHVMDEEARRHFDLESMLSGAESTVSAGSHDDIPDIPPPRRA